MQMNKDFIDVCSYICANKNTWDKIIYPYDLTFTLDDLNERKGKKKKCFFIT